MTNPSKDARSGVPDLSQLKESPDVYFERHRVAVDQHDFPGRVTACWGLIARGVDSVPYLNRMLRSTSPEAREDAAGAFGWIAINDPSVVDDLIETLESETDQQVVDSLVVALGRLRDQRAVGALARLVRGADTDSDTRHTAIQSLERIARRRFDRAPDPLVAASEWLDTHLPDETL